MKKLLIILVIFYNYSLVNASSCASLESGVEEMAEYLVKYSFKEMPTLSTLRITVVDFYNLRDESNGTYKDFVSYLTSTTTRTFVSSKAPEYKKVEIVPRDASLEKVVNELMTQQSELFNEKTISKLGQFKGADAIFIGEFTNFSSGVEIIGHLFLVESGQNIASEKIVICKEDKVVELIKDDPFKPKSSKSFFGLGLSGYYLFSSKQSENYILGGTLDVHTFKHYLAFNLGYSHTNYKDSDLSPVKSHFLAGTSLLLNQPLRLGFMVGFPINVDNTLKNTFKQKKRFHYSLMFDIDQKLNLGFWFAQENKTKLFGASLGIH